jgi:hypothetical protein
MVKAYLRYEAQATFGIIASSTANIVYDHSGKIAIAPALEEVILWDLKKGVEVMNKLFYTNCIKLIEIYRLVNGENLEISLK